MATQNANEISEQLFEAIDAIVEERIRLLDYDKTIVATIIENSQRQYGKYTVTTDENITFPAYADITNYDINQKVYVRIPGNDYTKQKVIIDRYIQRNRTDFVPEFNSASIELLKQTVQEQAALIEEKSTIIDTNKAEIETLQKKNKSLEKEISDLKSKINSIYGMLSSISSTATMMRNG